MKIKFLEYFNNEISIKAIAIYYIFLNAVYTFFYYDSFHINYFSYADTTEIISKLLLALVEMSKVSFAIICVLLSVGLFSTYKTRTKRRSKMRLVKYILLCLILFIILAAYLRFDLFSLQSVKQKLGIISIKFVESDISILPWEFNLMVILIVFSVCYHAVNRTIHDRNSRKKEKLIFIRLILFLAVNVIVIENARISAKWDTLEPSKSFTIKKIDSEKFETIEGVNLGKVGDYTLVFKGSKFTLIRSDYIFSIE